MSTESKLLSTTVPAKWREAVEMYPWLTAKYGGDKGASLWSNRSAGDRAVWLILQLLNGINYLEHRLAMAKMDAAAHRAKNLSMRREIDRLNRSLASEGSRRVMRDLLQRVASDDCTGPRVPSGEQIRDSADGTATCWHYTRAMSRWCHVCQARKTLSDITKARLAKVPWTMPPEQRPPV